MIDLVLDHRRQIGDRRWGMVQLYYRTGLTQREIARIFGVNRQMVTYELKQAFKIVSQYLECREEDSGQADGRARSRGGLSRRVSSRGG
jgi:DNA-binding transcriptional regulator LsrR (DeoR family)